MRRTAAFIALTILSCIVLSAAAPVLQCIGKRQSDGQFYFNMSDALNNDVKDCETQWVINGTVVGISDADGNINVMPPLVMATANAAIVQTCHEKFEYLLICPSAGINKKEQCSCQNVIKILLKRFFDCGMYHWCFVK
ncbi:hypothetical protein ROHU_001403 [Labeo rohita]|uniref:Uncharacterized protein n=1 Tax=Labeo rohita TaxID=84645 RepID=A0A498P1N9_LABRO|nr:hypothetical protein ROHU_001403 [Labeo rohita]